MQWLRFMLGLRRYSAVISANGAVLIEPGGAHFDGQEIYTLHYGKGSLSRGAASWFYRHTVSKLPDSRLESKSWSDTVPSIDIEDTIIMPHEAYYMAQLGMLSVFRTSNHWVSMSLLEIADCFGNDFPTTYAVYYHYKSRGWIVRDGSQYGANFLLYNEPPEFCHSEFAVKVCLGGCVSLKSMLASIRVCSIVKKRFLFCSMHTDSDTLQKLSGNARVSELELSRWNPELTRS